MQQMRFPNMGGFLSLAAGWSRIHMSLNSAIAYDNFMSNGDDRNTHRSWTSRKGVETSYHLPETVQELRLSPSGGSVTIVGRRRQWSLSIRDHLLSVKGWVDPWCRPVVSDDGSRVMQLEFSRKHVIKEGGKVVAGTNACPVFVYASGKTGSVMAGLCSREVLYLGGDGSSACETVTVPCDGPALCGVLRDGYGFLGCMDGTLCVFQTTTKEWVRTDTVRGGSPVRCLDVVPLGVAGYCIVTGHHDGTVRTYSWSPPTLDAPVLHSIFCDLHASAVTSIVGNPVRMVTADEDGHVKVSNRLGVTLWSFWAGSEEVLLDMDDRYLVVGCDRTVRVWDHGVVV